jgi:hypothetical protein
MVDGPLTGIFGRALISDQAINDRRAASAGQARSSRCGKAKSGRLSPGIQVGRISRAQDRRDSEER